VRGLFDAPAAGSSRLGLDYFARKMTMAWTIAEDAYAEHSRRYAMRITWIALGICGAVLMILCLAARI